MSSVAFDFPIWMVFVLVIAETWMITVPFALLLLGYGLSRGGSQIVRITSVIVGFLILSLVAFLYYLISRV